MITRSKMRRQLYRGGGIADLYPRQKYGIGSWVKERVRKLIPNELADVAAKAAPFVAPFNPLAAGIMRGVGRFDKRGSMSDALKQGLLTYGGGQVVRHLGGAGMQTGFDPRGGMGGGMFTSPIQQGGPISNMFKGFTGGAEDKALSKTGRIFKDSDPLKYATDTKDQGFFSKVLFGKEGGTGMFGDKGLIGAGGEFNLGQSFGKGVPAVFAGSTIAAYAAQKALGDVGERESGESLEAYNKRRKGTVGQYLDFYYRRANRFRIPPEEMDAAAAKFVEDNTKEYVSHGGRIGFSGGGGYLPIGMHSAIGEAYEEYLEENKDSVGPLMSYKQFWNNYIDNLADGGRVGYQTGGITMANTLQENIRRNQAQAAANEGVLAAARSKLPGYVAPTTPEQKATVAATNLTNSMLPKASAPIESPYMSPSVPRDPIPREALMAGFEDYIKDNPDAMSGIGTSAMMPVTLPGGYEYDFSGSTEANAFNKYLESIGQAPYTRRQSPIPLMGKMEGDFGPDGIVIDGKRYYSEKEAIEDMGIERYNMFMSKGGRVGFAFGTSEEGIKSLDAGAPDITYEGNEGPKSPQQMANDNKGKIDLMGDLSSEDMALYNNLKSGLFNVFKDAPGSASTIFEMLNPLDDKDVDFTSTQARARKFDSGNKELIFGIISTKNSPEKRKEFLKNFTDKYNIKFDKLDIEGRAMGGRIGQMIGTGPAGLPGIPKMAPDGMEFDMRENGGFQPLGAKEKKDDVPAMLAKNEFVFTADAVRGAGGGDIELGAQRMYDTMKNLEKRVV